MLRAVGFLELTVESVERFWSFVRTDDLDHRLVFRRISDHAHRVFVPFNARQILFKELYRIVWMRLLPTTGGI